MTKDFTLRRNRAAVAVLTLITVAACSDAGREPTAPGKALPGVHAKSPTWGYSFQDGSQITVYDDEGGWSRLDVAAQTLTNGEGLVAPLTSEQTVAFLNDYQATVTFDNLANAVQGLPPCMDYCIEPTSAGTQPLAMPQGSTSSGFRFEVIDRTPVKAKSTDKFGVQLVDFDKTIKEMSKSAKSSGADILQWPPNCRVAIDEVRAAKDEYAANRHSTTRSISEIFRGVFDWNPVTVARRVVERMPELADKFFFKSLSQTKLSIASALYAGICNGSLPPGTAGYGWYPGAVLTCENIRGKVSFDGGVNWYWATIRICSYHSQQ